MNTIISSTQQVAASKAVATLLKPYESELFDIVEALFGVRPISLSGVDYDETPHFSLDVSIAGERPEQYGIYFDLAIPGAGVVDLPLEALDGPFPILHRSVKAMPDSVAGDLAFAHVSDGEIRLTYND